MFTFMSEGKHRVERIPREWVEDLRQQVEAGREFQSAVREVLTANAELLILDAVGHAAGTDSTRIQLHALESLVGARRRSLG